MVIASCYCQKIGNMTLEPMTKMLRNITDAIRDQDCMDMVMNIELVALCLANFHIFHSDSPGFEIELDTDVDGVTLKFVDYSIGLDKNPKVLSKEQALDKVLSMPDSNKFKDLYQIMAYCDYLTIKYNVFVCFFRWIRPVKDHVAQ